MALVKRLASNRGQMAVELAVVMPVLIVLVIISVDCMVYLGDCARFDRISGEIVRIHAASPVESEQGTAACAKAIQKDIETVMDSSTNLSVSVTCSEMSSGENDSAVGTEGVVGFFTPRLREYRCALDYTPWPLTKGAFGFAPTPLSHERRYIIDPYRPGVFL